MSAMSALHTFLFALPLMMALAPASHADPGARWEPASPAPAWAPAVHDALERYASAARPTAIMIVHDGRVAASWGEVSRKVNVRSVRKSLLSALYGFAVAEKRVRLMATLEELGINEIPPGLTPAEQKATVRDLLMARSGIYHPAAYETADMRGSRPARASHAPGEFWYYNNWDFNALGTIYRKATGEDIFESFARRVGTPIGMQDFTANSGRYIAEESSAHPAYPFFMSARDLARFGQLILNDGVWRGTRILPPDWTREATTPYSATDRGERRYGYMWWVPPADRWGQGAAEALGFGGQIITILPAEGVVAVQTVDLRPGDTHGAGARKFHDLLTEIRLLMR